MQTNQKNTIPIVCVYRKVCPVKPIITAIRLGTLLTVPVALDNINKIVSSCIAA